jgi:AraC-like DNA-binding protein
VLQDVLETKLVVQTIVLAIEVAVLWWMAGRIARARTRTTAAVGLPWTAFLFVTGLYLFPWMLGHAGWYALDGYRELLFYLPLQQLLLFGPLVYLTVREAARRPVSFKMALPHFAPALLYTLVSVWMAVSDLLLSIEPLFYADGRDKDLLPGYQIVGFISYLGYVLLAFREARSAELLHLTFRSTVTVLLTSLVILIGVRGAFLLVYPGFGHFSAYFYYYLLYGLIVSVLSVRFGTSFPRSVYRVEKSDGRGEAYRRLVELLEGKRIYRNPELQLADLAAGLDLSKKEVSALIRQHTGGNFNELINRYRVGEVQRLIREDRHRSRTLLALALEAGFNSKSTFNRVFKRQTGQTPKQFVDDWARKQVPDRGIGRREVPQAGS